MSGDTDKLAQIEGRVALCKGYGAPEVVLPIRDVLALVEIARAALTKDST